ncbi:DUF5069 domain-containing protein [Akkermansiaceae bacterium]|nr:DUF5069 domain-containing protein [Akkermansiaceae bacterium]
MSKMSYPVSPKEYTDGLCYFARMCDKVRLSKAGELPKDYHNNLGKGMDLWTCQLLEVEYEEFSEKVKTGLSNLEVLKWAYSAGRKPSSHLTDWWNSYMRNRGVNDDLSEKLAMRIAESGFENRGIVSFFDYLDADEER